MKTRLVIAIAPVLYRFYMGLVYLTSKKTHKGFDKLWNEVQEGGRIIAALLHQDIVLAPHAYSGRNVLTIASRSRDGEIITRIVERLGFKVVRGSSSQGGSRAIKEMVEHLTKGGAQIAAITVDGPRGPAKKVKPGVLFLAHKSGATIYPVSCRAQRNIRLNSWDRTQIPLPFNHLIFQCGRGIIIPKDAKEKELQKLKETLEVSLKEISRS